jgi:hypothetical protein
MAAHPLIIRHFDEGARQNVESMGGALSANDLPGLGCVFTIAFPSFTTERRSDYGHLV